MNTPLLVVLPFCANDAKMAELLCDFIFLVNRREQHGHCLLVVAGDVHAEMRAKVRVAAEVAFSAVDIIDVNKIVNPNKNVHVNEMFRSAAEHVGSSYRVAWLWLEPDAVPVKYGWLDALAEAHYEQAKRYSGPWKKVMSADGPTFLNRVAIYPPDSMRDLAAPLALLVPFNIAAGNLIIPKATKLKLIQEVAITDESTKLLPTTVLAHCDKQGILMNSMREKFEAASKKK